MPATIAGAASGWPASQASPRSARRTSGEGRVPYSSVIGVIAACGHSCGAIAVMWPVVRGDTDSGWTLAIRSLPHQARARAVVSAEWRPKIFSPWP